MTKVHAYLARIKDQEKEVIAVPDGAGRALCVSSDKHWTLTREWGELHIIAPLVNDADLKRTRADDDAARWRRAHSIVEQERDTARSERDEWQASADKWHGEWQKIAPARTVTREDVDEAVRGTLDGSNITLPDNLFDAQIDAVCALFGVEAEPADPVEEKARELYRAATPDARWETVADEYRRIAAHVLGQEAGDE